MGFPIKVANNQEATALGAALLAGLAVGMWCDLDEISKLQNVGARFQPNTDVEERAEHYAGWQRAVEATRMF